MQNKSVQEKETQQRTTLLIERVTACCLRFLLFLLLFVRITNAREFNIYIYIIASGGGEGGGV